MALNHLGVLMNLIDEEDLRQRERANSISAAVFLGFIAAMLLVIFAGDGRVFLMMMGG
jgi:hypothetical protein